MALALAIPQAASRAPIRACAPSGTSPAAKVSFVTVPTTPSQLLSRLEALRTKSRSADVPRAGVALSPLHLLDGHRGPDEVACSHFGDCHARLEHWWKEHLEDKAALVHAACRNFPPAPPPTAEEEHLFEMHPVPVERYPAQEVLYHF